MKASLPHSRSSPVLSSLPANCARKEAGGKDLGSAPMRKAVAATEKALVELVEADSTDGTTKEDAELELETVRDMLRQIDGSE